MNGVRSAGVLKKAIRHSEEAQKMNRACNELTMVSARFTDGSTCEKLVEKILDKFVLFNVLSMPS